MTEACNQIGRPDFLSNVGFSGNPRVWLNNFLEKIYKAQDWNWLKTDSTVIALVQGSSVPTGYWKMSSANLYYATSGVQYVQREIVQFNGEGEYQAYLRMGYVSGQPQKLYVDKQAGTFNFWPPPDYNYSWRHFSWIIPSLPDPTDNTQDSLTPVWPLASQYLIDAVQLKGLFYQDEMRYQEAEKLLIQDIIEGKMNQFDSQAGNNSLKLGKKFRRRW